MIIKLTKKNSFDKILVNFEHVGAAVPHPSESGVTVLIMGIMRMDITAGSPLTGGQAIVGQMPIEYQVRESIDQIEELLNGKQVGKGSTEPDTATA